MESEKIFRFQSRYRRCIVSMPLINDKVGTPKGLVLNGLATVGNGWKARKLYINRILLHHGIQIWHLTIILSLCFSITFYINIKILDLKAIISLLFVISMIFELSVQIWSWKVLKKELCCSPLSAHAHASCNCDTLPPSWRQVQILIAA